jgi:hypothetical protein
VDYYERVFIDSGGDFDIQQDDLVTKYDVIMKLPELGH